MGAALQRTNDAHSQTKLWVDFWQTIITDQVGA